jgi:hypothetical protein
MNNRKDVQHRYHIHHRAEIAQRQRARRSKYKNIVLAHYGARCQCCGETQQEFLGIDHIYGGGEKERNKNGTRGSQLYLWIIQNHFPGHLRILCYNCNLSLGYLGYCPHEIYMIDRLLTRGNPRGSSPEIQ